MNANDSIEPDRNCAEKLMKWGRPAEAVPIYRRLVEAWPDEDSHLLALAWALYDSGERMEAAACFEKLFQRELSRRLFSGFAYDELVRIYRDDKNNEALISVCERAAAAQPADAGILQTLGETYLSAGRIHDAIRVFEQLAEGDPDAPEYRCLLGDAALCAGDTIRAEAEYNIAVELDPSDQAAFLSRLAEGLLRAGNSSKAKTVWERCLSIRSDEPLFWMGLGDCLVDLNEPEDATTAYSRAASLSLADAGNCWNRLGNLFTKKGLHAHAAGAFLKALSFETENPLYLLRLAASHAALGQNDLAAEALRRLEELNPSLKPYPS